jgi:hypothetical protein
MSQGFGGITLVGRALDRCSNFDKVVDDELWLTKGVASMSSMHLCDCCHNRLTDPAFPVEAVVASVYDLMHVCS